jgi:GAF domain-containing protein
MREFFRSLSPTVSPEYIDQNDKLKVWQERILHSLFLIGAFFGLLFSFLLYRTSVQSQNYVIFWGAIGLLVVCLIFFSLRRISYWVRSIIALAIIFVFANLVYFNSGWTGVSLILLLVFSFLSTTLLYQTPSRVGLFLSLTTLLVWATLRFTNIISGSGLTSSLSSVALDLLLVLLAGLCFNLIISSLKNKYLEIDQRNAELISQKNAIQEQMLGQTQTLERRVSQLRTAADITKTISSVIEPQVLIRQVADALKSQFALYYVGVFLVDSLKEFAILQYGTGEAGRRMMANRHRLAVGGYSMIGWTTQTRKARIALDIGNEAVHFDNPFLPETRSELALPIATTSNLYGALTIQSEHAGYFDENDIIVLQSIADSLAIALENNNSFEKTQKALEEIRVLNKAYVQQAWGEAIKTHGNLEANFVNPDMAEAITENRLVKVPLYLREEMIGEIELEVVGGELTDDDQEFLRSISDQTTSALENARLIDETQRAAANEQKLNSLSTQFSRALTIEEILRTAVTEFGKLPSVSEASISILPPEETTLGQIPERRTR